METLNLSYFTGSVSKKECTEHGYHLTCIRKVIHDYKAFNSYVHNLRHSLVDVFLFSYNQKKHLICYAIGSDLNKV